MGRSRGKGQAGATDAQKALRPLLRGARTCPARYLQMEQRQPGRRSSFPGDQPRPQVLQARPLYPHGASGTLLSCSVHLQLITCVLCPDGQALFILGVTLVLASLQGQIRWERPGCLEQSCPLPVTATSGKGLVRGLAPGDWAVGHLRTLRRLSSLLGCRAAEASPPGLLG